MKKLLARLVRQSPAMIVAMLALFVALTGTAVATTSALITGKQIANSSITGLDVKNKSLTPKDFKGSVRGPRGLRGATGATGAPGAPGAPGAKGDKGDKGDIGPSNGYSVNSSTIIGWTGAEQAAVSLALPAGKYVLNGFVNLNNNDASQQFVSCRLALGGTTVGDIEGVNLAANVNIDRQVIAITAGGTLAAAGSAQLLCDPANADGNFVGQGLTAIQVAALNGT